MSALLIIIITFSTCRSGFIL